MPWSPGGFPARSPPDGWMAPIPKTTFDPQRTMKPTTAIKASGLITALSLGGVGSVAASDTTNGNLGFNYTTTVDGGFVVGNATNNSFNFSSPPTVSSSNLDTNAFYSNISGNSSSQQIYGVIDTAGTYTDTYSNSTVSSGVAFEAAMVNTQVSVGWKEIYAIVERSLPIVIQIRFPCLK